jgi:hypothetical protein
VAIKHSEVFGRNASCPEAMHFALWRARTRERWRVTIMSTPEEVSPQPAKLVNICAMRYLLPVFLLIAVPCLYLYISLRVVRQLESQPQVLYSSSFLIEFVPAKHGCLRKSLWRDEMAKAEAFAAS